MESYLQIYGQETNSKTMSGMLIDAMRLIDNLIMSDFSSTEKERRYFLPEEYIQIDGVTCGSGSWRIHRKGIALLVEHFDSLRRNPHYIRKVADDEYNRFYSNGSVDYETRIEEIYKSVQSTTDSCFSYLAKILSVMVIEGKKYVDAEWV